MMPEQSFPNIRQARSDDEVQIHALLEEAFENPGEANLVHALRHDGDMALEMVAERDGDVVGHIAYSTVRAPVWALALAPLSVAPPVQKQGIGAALMSASLQRLREKQWEAVFVLGDPDYYARFGFDADKARAFSSAYDGKNFMALELVPGCLRNHSGEIRHAPAFGKLS